MIYINIATDFSKTPGGRYKKDGPYSGEEFRDNILIPKYKEAINNDTCLCVNLDGVLGYPLSFLDEAFGGLIVQEGNDRLSDILLLTCEDEPCLVKKIYSIINEARIKIGIEPRVIPIKKSKINYKILLKAIIEVLIILSLVIFIPLFIFKYTKFSSISLIIMIIISFIIVRYQALIDKNK